MNKKNFTLLSHFSIYFVASLINAFISFLFTPSLTKYLGPAGFGKLELFNSLSNILLNLALFGTSTFYVRNFYNKTKEENSSIFFNIVAFNFITSLSFSLVYMIVNSFMPKNLQFDSKIVFLTFVVVFLGLIRTIYLTDLQLNSKSILYSIITVTEVVVEYSVTILIFKYIFIDYYVKILASIFPLSAIFVIVVIKIVKIIKYKTFFSINIIRELFIFGLPFVLSSISSWVMEMIDKIFVSGIVGLEQNAIYSVGYKFGMVIMMVEISFSRAWAPYFYKNIKDHASSVLCNIVILTVIFLIGIVIYIPISKLILKKFFDDSYILAETVIPIICFSYFFDHLWKIINNYLIYIDRTWFYNFSLIFAGLMNIVLNMMLIPKYQLYGAAVATLISFCTGFLVSLLYFVIKVHEIHARSKNGYK